VKIERNKVNVDKDKGGRKTKEKLKKLQYSLEKTKKGVEKWKKRFQRLQTNESSNQGSSTFPGKVVTESMKAGSREVKKQFNVRSRAVYAAERKYKNV